MKPVKIDFFCQLDRFPSIPWQIIKELDEVGTSSCMDYNLVGMIQRDASVACRVLKVANEPLYGYGGKISSIQQATGLLGPGMLKNIILTTPILDSCWKEGNSDFGIDYTGLGIHMVLTGVAAEWVGGFNKDIDTDVCFTAGLICGMGKLALATFYPEFYVKSAELCAQDNVSPDEAEIRMIGFKSSEIGLNIARAWNYPDQLVKVFEFQAAGGKAQEKDNLSDIVCLAGYLAAKLNYREGSPPPKPLPETVARAGVSQDQMEESWAGLEGCAKEMIQKITI